MTSNQVLQKLIKIVAEVMCTDEESIEPDSLFTEDLNADSLDIAQIMMSVEDEFNVTIEDNQMENIKTIQDAAEAISDAMDDNV